MGDIRPGAPTPETIPFDEYGKGEKAVVFLHANGYPPLAYKLLFDALSSEYSIMAMRMRPLWGSSQPKDIKDWRIFSHDLIQFVQQIDVPRATVIGHSMGGTIALRAALWVPELFDKLVLIDPVILPLHWVRIWKLFKVIGLLPKVHPLIKSAQRRRNSFANINQMFENYRKKSVFKYLSDESLMAYVKSMACNSPTGEITLCFSPEWEAKIYATGVYADVDIWKGIRNLRTPTLIIRGEESNTFWESTAQKFRDLNNRIEIATLPNSTHLLPLEYPENAALLINRFLSVSDYIH